jgi:putative hemolysin
MSWESERDKKFHKVETFGGLAYPTSKKSGMAANLTTIIRAAAPLLRPAQYAVRLAKSAAERQEAYRLRFHVFNLELQEGLQRSYDDGQDVDPYDAICDHLIVENIDSRIIGTYRLQTGFAADRNLGFYSEREFDFTPYRRLRAEMLELGRACVHRDHRSFEVVTALWRGIGQYALEHGCRYLVGCSSLTSQDPAEGWAAYRKMKAYLVEPALQTQALGKFQMPNAENVALDVKIPKLLRTYLAVGAKIAGEPAIDRDFKTIDFLTWLDLRSLTPAARMRYLGQ